MEKSGDMQRNSVVNELTQGKKLANELKRKLQPDITSRETCNLLLEKILTNYDNALSIIDCMSSLGNGEILSQPKSRNQTRKDHVNKKRKMSEKKKDEVRVCSWNGTDSQLTDGYNWRKYGQKDILGAVHPRAYYRCTHRQTQGCLATKKVQQMDKDPSTFQVIYKGKHSCCIDEESRQKKDEETVLPFQINDEEQILPPPPLVHEKNLNSFSFQTTPYEENQATDEPHHQLTGTTYSTPFLLSPGTPESYFSMSTSCQMNDIGTGCSNSFGQDSGFNGILSDTTSFANFQLGNFDLQDFDCDFFDASDNFYPSLM